MSHGVNEPLVVRHEYESEDRFLARRLSTWAELDGPLVEDRALDALVEQQPRRVLEVGCGTGDFSARVRDALRGVFVAVDLSHRMAALARARGLIAQVADIESLPFADSPFDAVLANRVLYHVPDLDRGLREIVRVLRPGGCLVAVTYSERHLEELAGLLDRPLIASTFSAESGPPAIGAPPRACAQRGGRRRGRLSVRRCAARLRCPAVRPSRRLHPRPPRRRTAAVPRHLPTLRHRRDDPRLNMRSDGWLHFPMNDDPSLVAQEIAAWHARTTQESGM